MFYLINNHFTILQFSRLFADFDFSSKRFFQTYGFVLISHCCFYSGWGWMGVDLLV